MKHDAALPFCHRCARLTPTVFLALSSGHIGNCCAECRTTRKGRPFVSKAAFAKSTTQENTNARAAEGENHASVPV